MTQYKITTKEYLGGGICKMTFEDEHSDTAWGRSVTEAVNTAIREECPYDFGNEWHREGIVACWSLTVWVDTLEDSP